VGVSALGHWTPYGIHAMGLLGFAIPLAWGWRTGRWAEMGFTRQNWRAALAWGLAFGVVTSLVGWAAVGFPALVPSPLFQLAIAVPFSLLMASPFQEFFFRGWLQPRFERALGGWPGLLVANCCFVAWHYISPMFSGEGSSFPLNTAQGFAATFFAGLAYGYIFQRTRNILAPVIAHAIALITFVLVGAMVLTGSLG
jgi:membrane protease YdiL (CAAX protease family)